MQLSRVRAAWLRARSARLRRGRPPVGRLLSAAVCLLAGLMVVTSALNARGTDLRPGRYTDLVGLVQAQSRRNTDLSREVTTLRAEVDALSARRAPESDVTQQLGQKAAEAGLTAVRGPAVSVTLDDAPDTVAADGIDPDLLVVHQQDIQAVVNALWRGGAEAMTIQGQRVISTTGVKCVGNTVVLHGIPYAPPYVIEAIGNPAEMRAALSASEPVRIYQQYVEAFGLGYRLRSSGVVTFGGHEGALDLQHARPYGLASGPTDTPTPR